MVEEEVHTQYTKKPGLTTPKKNMSMKGAVYAPWRSTSALIRQIVCVGVRMCGFYVEWNKQLPTSKWHTYPHSEWTQQRSSLPSSHIRTHSAFAHLPIVRCSDFSSYTRFCKCYVSICVYETISQYIIIGYTLIFSYRPLYWTSYDKYFITHWQICCSNATVNHCRHIILPNQNILFNFLRNRRKYTKYHIIANEFFDWIFERKKNYSENVQELKLMVLTADAFGPSFIEEIHAKFNEK